jgi:hypothetical protein
VQQHLRARLVPEAAHRIRLERVEGRIDIERVQDSERDRAHHVVGGLVHHAAIALYGELDPVVGLPADRPHRRAQEEVALHLTGEATREEIHPTDDLVEAVPGGREGVAQQHGRSAVEHHLEPRRDTD